mmetsp:Transcript_13101/g.21347  ORF Transcript_13101/g.21347 Transcript_13101/m.21347 type:complete len:216 (-) Transcript_13101:189-836(-)
MIACCSLGPRKPQIPNGQCVCWCSKNATENKQQQCWRFSSEICVCQFLPQTREQIAVQLSMPCHVSVRVVPIAGAGCAQQGGPGHRFIPLVRVACHQNLEQIQLGLNFHVIFAVLLGDSQVESHIPAMPRIDCHRRVKCSFGAARMLQSRAVGDLSDLSDTPSSSCADERRGCRDHALISQVYREMATTGLTGFCHAMLYANLMLASTAVPDGCS